MAGAIDAGLYALLPDVTVCYRCQAHLRGFVRNPRHHAFDLHLAEQYHTHDADPASSTRRAERGELPSGSEVRSF